MFSGIPQHAEAGDCPSGQDFIDTSPRDSQRSREPLDRQSLIVCSGKRSAEAVEFLRSAGFRKVLNLKGGILAWSDEVDASVPKY